MRIVHEAIRDRVGVDGVSDGMVPRGRGKLAGDDGRLSAVAVLKLPEQVMASRRLEGWSAPVIQDEHLDLGEAFHSAGDTAIAACKGEIVEQPREAHVGDGALVAAGPVTDGAGEHVLADTDRSADRQIVVRVDPFVPEEGLDESADGALPFSTRSSRPRASTMLIRRPDPPTSSSVSPATASVAAMDYRRATRSAAPQLSLLKGYAATLAGVTGFQLPTSRRTPDSRRRIEIEAIESIMIPARARSLTGSVRWGRIKMMAARGSMER